MSEDHWILPRNKKIELRMAICQSTSRRALFVTPASRFACRPHHGNPAFSAPYHALRWQNGGPAQPGHTDEEIGVINPSGYTNFTLH